MASPKIVLFYNIIITSTHHTIILYKPPSVLFSSHLFSPPSPLSSPPLQEAQLLKALAEDLAIKKAMLNARLRKRAEKQDRDESSRRAGAEAGAGGSAKEGQEQYQYQYQYQYQHQHQHQHQHQSYGVERKDIGHGHTSPQKLKSSLTSVEELVDAEANEALEIAALER